MDSSIIVEVLDQKGKIVKKDHQLTRNQQKTMTVLDTGHITTFSNYESNWYSFEQIEKWVDQFWGKKKSFHFKCKKIDMVRAEPSQMAIYDPGNHLNDLFKYWDLHS
jgi:hypothetical protein